MFVRNIKDCMEITALDNCRLRELFNPLKDVLELNYSLAWARVEKGKATAPHRLSSSEVYYIIQGGGTMHISSEVRDVAAGEAVYIPPMAVQYIENTGDCELVFVCMVEPAWRKEEDERVKESK